MQSKRKNEDFDKPVESFQNFLCQIYLNFNKEFEILAEVKWKNFFFFRQQSELKDFELEHNPGLSISSRVIFFYLNLPTGGGV